jgi:hypothetical protein
LAKPAHPSSDDESSAARCGQQLKREKERKTKRMILTKPHPPPLLHYLWITAEESGRERRKERERETERMILTKLPPPFCTFVDNS